MDDAARSPAVSIILPTFDRAHLLGRALDSVLAQSWSDFELLVVDDASRDHTREVVAGRGDRRIRYLRLEHNVGPAAARNRGIAAARGRYFAFQDSDDEWMPAKLARQVVALEERPSLGMVYCDMVRVHRNGVETPHHSPALSRGRWIDPRTGFYGAFGLGIQSAVIRRAALEAVGPFDERYRCFEDLDLFLRLSSRWECLCIEEPLVRYYETGGQTSQWQAELRARRGLLRRHGAALWTESPGFVLREGALVAGRTLLRGLGRSWLGRPAGPPPRGERP